MSDGGAAFWAWRGVSRFTRLLEEMGVDQLIAKVPQHNGKLEVLNANVQKELFNQQRFFDLGEAAARLRAWVAFSTCDAPIMPSEAFWFQQTGILEGPTWCWRRSNPARLPRVSVSPLPWVSVCWTWCVSRAGRAKSSCG